MIGFGAPLVLAGFIVLPAIWWLLRLTPPRPETETFPPLKILMRIIRKDETPHKSPWWLTLLRLALASLLILALARPMLNPQADLSTGDGPVALLIDNSWISGPDWDARQITARGLIEDAGERGQPVLMAFSAMAPNAEIGPFETEAALERLEAAQPEPVSSDRNLALARLTEGARDLAASGGVSLALLSDGLAAANPLPTPDATVFSSVTLFSPAERRALALTGTDNGADAMVVAAARDPSQMEAAVMNVTAFDSRSRPIASAPLTFAAGEDTGEARIELPFELRNAIASIAIDATPQAGAVRLLDSTSGRRRVALVAAATADGAQPLLAPLHYIRQALLPFADIVEPEGDDLEAVIAQALDDRPSVVVLADVGVMPEAARTRLQGWVEDGGMLIRFAGPRLAATESGDDALLPVRLRSGERALDGALSWNEPQPIAAFPAVGPFAGLPAPQDVSVRRQVLAEPDISTPERTWASLTDGTPLVTGRTLERGTVALFHVGSDAVWSNLPISGSFVDMLRRLVRLSSAAGSGGDAAGGTLAPLRTLDAQGRLGQPPATAKPAEAETPVSFENPPGLYGVADGFRAMNLFAADTRFAPLEPGADWPTLTRAAYADTAETDLRGPLFAGGLLLLLLDALAVLWMSGALRGAARAPRRVAASAALGLFVAGGSVSGIDHARAQSTDNAPAAQVTEIDELAAIEAISQTRIAYVLTGNAIIDETTEAGIRGLSDYLASRTALEPGAPMAVNPETDELAFYPLIYWPIDPDSPAPSAAALQRIDAYMKNGGTVLFDTRDQLTSGLDPNASPATRRLRDMLAGMNIPPLEPVPQDHVLTKSFFILTEFPGRYRGSPLWVEAANAPVGDQPSRPVRTLDGITPIMITGNDFAGAWAADAFGEPLYATVPDDPLQRLYAYRAGVNIMMVMLTGNYKSDQVHVPALLERLGQ
ncbi:MAG: DUF4159 domain-containing protein [Rhizobiaceae bacterium]|jgi:hypothetical protein|nr:DUF4159 domain-containing protein [Rhizobiaceae bacterium]